MIKYEITQSSLKTVAWNPLELDKAPEKMWTSDRRLWWTADGKLIAEKNGRIPADAIRLAAGVGGQVPLEAARASGLIEGATKK
jgi:hypothetical protein